MSFYEELKRRSVFRVGIAYVIVSWLVLQVVDVVLPMIGLPETAGRLILFLLLAGFPVVLVLGWAFEVTPEGIKRDEDVDRSQGTDSRAGRKLDFFIIGVLAVAVVFLVLDNYVWVDRPAAEPAAVAERQHSIAVLPFANRSASAEDAFFVDGIHDDILTQLAKLSALDKVISRTSVEQYRGTSKSIPQIASELGVTSILEGGVQRAANRVRINVQLIDASTDEHLWADTFDRELTASNIFAIQSEIAEAIASALQATLSPAEQQRISERPTDNLEAYEAYLFGRQRLALRTVAALQEAKQSFEQAVELDPGFVLAWVGIADSASLLRNYGGASLDILQEAEAAIDTALELDGQLGEAYAAMGYLRNQRRETEAAIANFERAIELSPNYAPTYHWYGNLLFETGNPEDGMRIRTRGLELDPLSLIMIYEAGVNLEALGRFDEALEHYEKTLEIDPDWIPGMQGVAMFHLLHGNNVEGIRWSRKVIAADPENLQMLPIMIATYIELGDPQKSEFWVERARNSGSDSPLITLAELIWSTFQNDDQGVLRHTEELYQEMPRCPDCILPMLNVYVRSGDLAKARQSVMEFFPELADIQNPTVTPLNIGTAVEFANILSSFGEHENADRLRAASLAQIARQFRHGLLGYGIADVTLLAQQGKHDDAIQALRQVVDEGWNVDWRFSFRSPSLDSITERPEFISIVNELEADMALQLEQIRELERNGELAPIPATLPQ